MARLAQVAAMMPQSRLLRRLPHIALLNFPRIGSIKLADLV
jgi:hypothetical protein